MASTEDAESMGVHSAIKEAIREVGTEADGAEVPRALERAALKAQSTEGHVEAEFDMMKKRGEVYVVPAEDEGRVKVTP
jgi:hypothetical protein